MTQKTQRPLARVLAGASALAFGAVMVLSGCPSKATGPAGATTTPKDKPGVTKPAGKTDTLGGGKTSPTDPSKPRTDVTPDNPDTKKVNADKPDAKKDPAKTPAPIKKDIKGKAPTR
jgi:hypothetical protein